MSTAIRLTIHEYDQMIADGAFGDGQRVELIRGELREMLPIGPPHEQVVDELTEWSIQNAPLDQVRVRVQNSIGLASLQSAPEPDITWVARKIYSKQRPSSNDVLLFIEVSDSSLRFDRGDKSELYAEAEIQDYWIVNLIDWCIEVRRRPIDGKYQEIQVFGMETTVRPLHFPDLTLPVSRLLST